MFPLLFSVNDDTLDMSVKLIVSSEALLLGQLSSAAAEIGRTVQCC